MKPGIKLVKKKHKKLEGAGLLDFIKKPFDKAPEKYTKSTAENIENYGNFKIISMQAKRTPVLKVLRKAINVVTSGKFEKNNNFDDLYHLALICQLENGVSIVIEKNETIKISRSYKMTKDTETIDIPMNNVTITVNELLDNCLRNIGSEDFFLYDAIRGRNCQDLNDAKIFLTKKNWKFRPKTTLELNFVDSLFEKFKIRK